MRSTWRILSVPRKYSRRSMPAEKESPLPVSTRTPQRSSASSASSTRHISEFSSGFIAFRLSGRCKDTHAMPSSNSTRTVFPQGSAISLIPCPNRSVTLHRQHDLAEMRVGAHALLRRRRLVQRKGAVDGQPELARHHRVPQVRAHASHDLSHFLDAAGAEGDAHVIDALQRVLVEIELRPGAAEAADIDDAAEHGAGLDGLVGP